MKPIKTGLNNLSLCLFHDKQHLIQYLDLNVSWEQAMKQLEILNLSPETFSQESSNPIVEDK